MDRSTSQSLPGISGFVYDPARDLIYMSSGALIYRWSPTTQQFLAPINVGGQLGDLDVSPDGSYLLVSQSNNMAPHPEALDRISLDSLSITPISFSNLGGSLDVVILDAHTALASLYPVREFDPSLASPGTSGVVGIGNDLDSSFLIRSEDRRYVFILDRGSSNAPMKIFDLQSNAVIASSDFYALGTSGFNRGSADINDYRGLVVNLSYNDIFVLNFNLAPVKHFGQFGGGAFVGAHFTESGKHLLLWDSRDDKIHVYDTYSWAEVSALAVPTDVGAINSNATWGAMDVIDSGQLLVLNTGVGFDVIDLAARLNLTLTGGTGDDVLYGDIGTDTLNGGDGNDRLVGIGGDDTLIGGAGNDTLEGGDGANTLTGGAGSDTYVVDSASDTIIEQPNEGEDLVFTSVTNFTLGPNLENLQFMGVAAFVGVGNGLDNLIIGGPGADALNGGAGNDTLIGGAGDDLLQGGGGVDTLTGGAGADTLIGSTAGGTLDGGDGADVLWFYGATTLIGGADFDYAIQLDGAGQTRSIGTAGIEVYVANSGSDTIDATGATSTTIIYGGAGADSITQSNSGGYAFGQDGNDTLTGGNGQDILLGGAGVDTIQGNGGDDVLYIDASDGQNFNGGAGVDYAIVDTAAAVNVNLTTRNVEVFIGNLGNDVINAGGTTAPMGIYGFGGDDVITGGSGASQLFGQDGNDILNAGSSNDVVLGGDGNDQIFGNAGADLLLGENGNDLIVGGAGADVMWGGGGNDTFRIAAADIAAGQDLIADFGDVSGNDDVINFTGITQSQVTIANTSGGALLTIAGGYSLLVVGATAASIQDDLLFS